MSLESTIHSLGDTKIWLLSGIDSGYLEKTKRAFCPLAFCFKKPLSVLFCFLREGVPCSQNASISGSSSAMVTSKFIIRHMKLSFAFLIIFFPLFILTNVFPASQSCGQSERGGKGREKTK